MRVLRLRSSETKLWDVLPINLKVAVQNHEKATMEMYRCLRRICATKRYRYQFNHMFFYVREISSLDLTQVWFHNADLDTILIATTNQPPSSPKRKQHILGSFDFGALKTTTFSGRTLFEYHLFVQIFLCMVLVDCQVWCKKPKGCWCKVHCTSI